jgi:hypothetical protein
MIQDYFILTEEDVATAQSLDTEEFQVAPRAIDNPAAPADLIGKSVLPRRIAENPDYAANLKAFLLTLPWAPLGDETIFAPVDI